MGGNSRTARRPESCWWPRSLIVTSTRVGAVGGAEYETARDVGWSPPPSWFDGLERGGETPAVLGVSWERAAAGSWCWPPRRTSGPALQTGSMPNRERSGRRARTPRHPRCPRLGFRCAAPGGGRGGCSSSRGTPDPRAERLNPRCHARMAACSQVNPCRSAPGPTAWSRQFALCAWAWAYWNARWMSCSVALWVTMSSLSPGWSW